VVIPSLYGIMDMARVSKINGGFIKEWDGHKRETLLPERRTKDAILGDVLVLQI
jgi:hypothetical protein